MELSLFFLLTQTYATHHVHKLTQNHKVKMAEPPLLDFKEMREDEMRQWASDNPSRMYELDCQGRTVLLAAVQLGRAAFVAWLIDEEGVSIHGHCHLPKDLLHFTRSVRVMTVLLARQADPTVLLADDLTVLMWQALHGNVGCVKVLLQDSRVKAMVNATTQKRGMHLTALHLVCERLDITLHARKRITELLLEAGADPNRLCRPGDPTSTPVNSLTYGHAVPPTYEHPDYCILSKADLRRWVTDNPGQVNKLDRKGYTLLRVAVKKGFKDVVEWLLDSHGVSVHHHVTLPYNLLHLCRQPDIMSLVLSRGVDPTVIVDRGLTLLMWHAKVGQAACVRSLLGDPRVRHTINATAMTQIGRSTALHFVCGAAGMDHDVRVELVKFLLDQGADPNFGYPSAIYSMPDCHRPAGPAGEPLYPHVGIIKKVLTDHQQSHACTDFYAMSEAQLQRWVIRNPERLHTRGKAGATLLRVATEKGYASLARWLIVEKEIGKDGHVVPPKTLLHIARTADLMKALLHLSLDLTALYVDGKTVLMWHAVFGSVDCVEALLQNARVLATMNATARHEKGEFTALQMVCETTRRNDAHRARIIQLLIRAGADINITPPAVSSLPIPWISTVPGYNANKLLPHPAQSIHKLSLASLTHAWEERGCALLIKARCIVTIHHSIKSAAPGVWASKDEKLRKQLKTVPIYLEKTCGEWAGSATGSVDASAAGR